MAMSYNKYCSIILVKLFFASTSLPLLVMSLSSCSIDTIEGSTDATSDVSSDSPQILTIQCVGGGIVAIAEENILRAEALEGVIETIEALPIVSPGDSDPILERTDGLQFSATFSVAGEYTIRLLARDLTDNEASCDIDFIVIDPTIEMVAVCPEVLGVEALSIVEMRGDVIGGSAPYTFYWELVEYPVGVPAEDISTMHATSRLLTTNLIWEGHYSFRFTAEDSDGNTDQCLTEIDVSQSSDLLIELIWNPPDRSCADADELPDCDPTDVDLHVVNLDRAITWFSLFDCYFLNCMWDDNVCYSSWDDEKPTLHRDDRNGYGPEIISIESPSSSHEYLIGVHRYMRAISPYPAFDVEVHIRVIAGGVVQYESGAISMNDSEDFLVLATVGWNGINYSVEEMRDTDGNLLFTTEAQAHIRLW